MDDRHDRRRERHRSSYRGAAAPSTKKVLEIPSDPKLKELLGDYFVTGGRNGEVVREKIFEVRRESSYSTRPQRPGETIVHEPVDIYTARYAEDEYGDVHSPPRGPYRSSRSRLRRTRPEYHDFDEPPYYELHRRRRGATFNVSEDEPRLSATRTYPRPSTRRQSPPVRQRSRSQHRRSNGPGDASVAESLSRAPSPVRSDGEEGMGTRVRRDSLPRQTITIEDARRTSRRARISSRSPERYEDVSRSLDPALDNVETTPSRIRYVFCVRYGQLVQLDKDLDVPIGAWSDRSLLERLATSYQANMRARSWWNWRSWWDGLLKEIGSLVLIQSECTIVQYRQKRRKTQEIVESKQLQYRIFYSIDLFGGKEASNQFRYIIRHPESLEDDSRLITTQIDTLAIACEQFQTIEREYYLILQVVEGQNSNAFIFGLLVIMISFLAFGLALGATSTLGWGDAFSIAGYGLACLSLIFALMAIAEYLGLEDSSPGNPINRAAELPRFP